jgi:hypothetical protein
MGLEKATTQAGGNATLEAGLSFALDKVTIGPDTFSFQLVKLDKGGDGFSSPVSDANPWPVMVMNQGSSLLEPIANSAIKISLVQAVPKIIPLAQIPATANGAILMLKGADLDKILYREDTGTPDADVHFVWRSVVGGESYLSINSRARLLGLVMLLDVDQSANGAEIVVQFYK